MSASPHRSVAFADVPAAELDEMIHLAHLCRGATRAPEISASRPGMSWPKRQPFEIVREIAEGDRVAIELVWTGTTQIAFRSLAVGDTMRARSARPGSRGRSRIGRAACRPTGAIRTRGAWAPSA